eukprot:gnl/MRDRNA2_/MRDRNA2_146255_c0_seq1.p1 gnl/MRDRNA2_/MRDRNA2_146255_c0~~gnl/MRDRNA2_/MRDRNA2_146255_c0_seq1.p1  ORF type:complete len:365 (-),score=75.06 gnl/MRDRNA2_/MRDRNA2_146255_c0_seq1:141-1235(-)
MGSPDICPASSTSPKSSHAANLAEPAEPAWLKEGFWAVAKFDRHPEEGCLTLAKGQWLWVQYVGDGEHAGWYYGTNESLEMAGWFPADFVEPWEEDKEQACKDGSDSGRGANSKSVNGALDDEDSSFSPPEASQAPLPPNPGQSPSHKDMTNSQNISLQTKSSASGIEPGCVMIQMAGSVGLDSGERLSMGMVSGERQLAEKRRQAALQECSLDADQREEIQRRRADSVERRRQSLEEEERRTSGHSELQAALARRRAASETAEGPTTSGELAESHQPSKEPISLGASAEEVVSGMLEPTAATGPSVHGTATTEGAPTSPGVPVSVTNEETLPEPTGPTDPGVQSSNPKGSNEMKHQTCCCQIL